MADRNVFNNNFYGSITMEEYDSIINKMERHGRDNINIYMYNLYHAYRQEKRWEEDYRLDYFDDHFHGVYNSAEDAAIDIYDQDYADLPEIMKPCIDWCAVGDSLVKGEDDAYCVYAMEVPGYGYRIFIYNNYDMFVGKD